MFDVYPPPPYPPEVRWTDVYTAHPAYGYALHPTHTVSFAYPPGSPSGSRCPTTISDACEPVRGALRGPYRPLAGPSRTEWRINELIIDRIDALGQALVAAELFPVLDSLALEIGEAG